MIIKDKILWHHDISCGGYTVGILGSGGRTERGADGHDLPNGLEILHFDEESAQYSEGQQIQLQGIDKAWEVIAVANLGAQRHNFAWMSETANGFAYLIKPCA